MQLFPFLTVLATVLLFLVINVSFFSPPPSLVFQQLKMKLQEKEKEVDALIIQIQAEKVFSLFSSNSSDSLGTENLVGLESKGTINLRYCGSCLFKKPYRHLPYSHPQFWICFSLY